MNPEIEKMMENERLQKEEAETAKREKNVSDQEMAAHYGSLHDTVAKKFAGKKRGHSEVTGNSQPLPTPEMGPDMLDKGRKLLQKAKDGFQAKKRKFMKPRDWVIF